MGEGDGEGGVEADKNVFVFFLRKVYKRKKLQMTYIICKFRNEQMYTAWFLRQPGVCETIVKPTAFSASAYISIFWTQFMDNTTNTCDM